MGMITFGPITWKKQGQRADDDDGCESHDEGS